MTNEALAVVPPYHQFVRAAGVALPLFALRGARDLGTGEILDLIPFVDWMDRWEQRVVQLLPINETAIGEASPYNTVSAFAIDPSYISVSQVPDVELAGLPRVHAQMQRSRQSPQRHRRRAYTLKLQLLETGFAAFQKLPASSDRAAAFDRFCRLNAWWLDDYAVFRAIKERRRWTSWETWPAALRARDATALQRTVATLQSRIRFFQYLQWIAFEQWLMARHSG